MKWWDTWNQGPTIINMMGSWKAENPELAARLLRKAHTRKWPWISSIIQRFQKQKPGAVTKIRCSRVISHQPTKAKSWRGRRPSWWSTNCGCLSSTRVRQNWSWKRSLLGSKSLWFIVFAGTIISATTQPSLQSGDVIIEGVWEHLVSRRTDGDIDSVIKLILSVATGLFTKEVVNVNATEGGTVMKGALDVFRESIRHVVSTR